MGFKENLLKKIRIDQLANQVRVSLKPSDPPKRIDRTAMQELLEMGPLSHRRERDLDLYCEGDGAEKQLILVLDNELKLYRTTVADVVLRKSPTVKEMVSIRNAIKILNDKDVVVSMKTETLDRLQNQLVEAIDLSYTDADITSLMKEGQDSLHNTYADGVVETLTLFGELLGYGQAPKAFQVPHANISGKIDRSATGGLTMMPVVIYSLMHNTLSMLHGPMAADDPKAVQRIKQAADGSAKADLEGEEVLEALKQQVLSEGRK